MPAYDVKIESCFFKYLFNPFENYFTLCSFFIILGRINRQRRENEESISAMKRKFVKLEARMCNGVYLWRITGFARHLEKARDNARENRARALYSPSFYTSFYGYKLSLRYVRK